MISFDCGRFCAPGNHDIPACCDNESTVPILYRDEFRWLKTRGRFWTRMRRRTKAARRLTDTLHETYVAAECPGPQACRRSLRSIACRAFPFDPYLDGKGRVLGLVYQVERRDRCPLVGKPAGLYNPAYVARAIRFWREILHALPEEREVYAKHSRKLRRRARRKGERVRIIRPQSGRGHTCK